ncbi:ribonuclease H-like domain-containing protein, partial [Tanacetum coccineum]
VIEQVTVWSGMDSKMAELLFVVDGLVMERNADIKDGASGIKREFSVARTPQQNGVAERKNKTLIDGCRGSLSLSLITDPYELVRGRTPLKTYGNLWVEEVEPRPRSEFERLLQQEKQTNSTNSFNTIGIPVSAAGPTFTNDDPSSPINAAEASNAFEEHLFE